MIENAQNYLAEVKQAAAMEEQERLEAETTAEDVSQSPESVSDEDSLTGTEEDENAEAENTQEN